MGLRWAQAISDLDPLRLSNREYLVRSRHQYLENRVYDYSSSSVDEFCGFPRRSAGPISIARKRQSRPFIPMAIAVPVWTWKSVPCAKGLIQKRATPRQDISPVHQPKARRICLTGLTTINCRPASQPFQRRRTASHAVVARDRSLQSPTSQ